MKAIVLPEHKKGLTSGIPQEPLRQIVASDATPALRRHLMRVKSPSRTHDAAEHAT